MAYNYEYPYADLSRANIDWLLNEFKAFKARLDDLYSSAADEIILHYLNVLLPEVTYDPEHRRVTLAASLIVTDGDHVYDPNTETLKIVPRG